MARRTALKRFFASCSALLLLSTIGAAQTAPATPPDATAAHREAALRQTQKLDKNWAIQSSCKVEAKGPAISAPDFKTTGWLPTAVPSTVFAAQVANGVYKDPYVGM